jgi:YidC/Oxa1 family membrane protein insertase
MWEAITGFFTTILYQPIYNGLVFLIDIIPGGEAGLAVIVLTLLVKIALFPLSIKSVRTQQTMKKVKPKIDEIKEKYSDDREKQAEKMMEAYGEYDVNPFSGFFLVLLQFPIIIALYYVFLRGGLPQIDVNLVYSFITMPNPELIDMQFLGANLSERSFFLAFIAAVSQFFQSWISDLGGDDSDTEPETTDGPPSFIEEFKDNIGGQLKYIFPGIVFAISWTLPAVVALYWATSNVFHVFQELYVKHTIKADDGNQESESDE